MPSIHSKIVKNRGHLDGFIIHINEFVIAIRSVYGGWR
jgi:hypothetical protein